MTLSIEVLPAPFGPMMARTSPFLMSNDTSRIARTPPNDSDTFSIERMISPAAMSLAAGALMSRPRSSATRAPVIGARSTHAAFSRAGATGTVATSRTFTRAESTPLRPSSKVTSVEMSASFEPS